MPSCDASGPFRDGELALLIDRRERRYLLKLQAGKQFHTHMGIIPHDSILGKEEGLRVRSTQGAEFICYRPTLAQYTQERPRSAQVIYPKDIGIILMWADIYPGATVVEGGLGAGALAMALLRAVGERGRLISYEVRPDFAAKGQEAIRAFMGDVPNHTVRIQDIYQGIEETGVDRVVLDVPEPWQAVPHATKALRGGGILLSYLPTVLQIHRLGQAIADEPSLQLQDAIEVLLRPWHLTDMSVRPEHRMVAHTGFIITARKCEPR